MHLATVVEQVAMECDLQKSTIDQYRLAVSRFSAWLGRAATDEDLKIENINGFLCSMQQRVGPTTVRNYRVGLTRVWNYLSETQGLAPYNVRRLRRPKINKKPVTSWLPDQVMALLKGAQDMLKRLRCGVHESDFMSAWIWVGYDTGLRPVDLRMLTWNDVDLDRGTIAITQHKTRNPHTAMLSHTSIMWLRKIQSPDRHLVFPLSKGGIRRLELQLYRLAKRHGFCRTKGQGIGTLRKSHATAIYSTLGEHAAAESLGHVGGVRTVRASYIDHRAIKQGRLPPDPSAA